MNLLNILTKGRLMRLMLALGLFDLIAFRLLAESPQEKQLIAFAFLLFGLTCVFYINLSWRLVSLLHSNHAYLTPHFMPKIKKGLFTLIGLSLLPSLVFLPNTFLGLQLIAGQLLAICIIGLCFTFPLLYWCIIGLLIFNGFSVYVIEFFNWQSDITQLRVAFFQGLAWSIPFSIIILAVMFWRLPHFRLNQHRLGSIISIFNGGHFKNLHTRDNTTVIGKSMMHFSKRKNVLKTSHSVQVKQALGLNKPLSKEQLVATANGSTPILTIRSMSIISLGFIAAYSLALVDMFIVSKTDLIIFALVGFSGSLVLFSYIHFLSHFRLSRRYLAKLRLMPLFANEADFSSTLLNQYYKQQALAIAFSTFFICLFFSVTGDLSLVLLAQFLSLYFVVFGLLTSLLLMSLRFNFMHSKIMIFVPVVLFIAINVYTLLFYFHGAVFSVVSVLLILFLTALVGHFSWANFKKHGINWQLV